jgi:hypothetical protein
MASSQQGRRSAFRGRDRVVAGCAGGSAATARTEASLTEAAPCAVNVGLNQSNWMAAIASGLTMPLILVAQPAARSAGAAPLTTAKSGDLG